MLQKKDIMDALSKVIDPELHKDIVSLGMVKDLIVHEENKINVTIELTTPACPLKGEIEADVRKHLEEIPGVGEIKIEMTGKVREKTKKDDLIPGVKHTILVGSGKGGVGKSTVAANLAVALAKTGAKVGLLDADIYGPSMNLMMGAKDEPVYTIDGTIMIPLERYGVKMISIGSLVEEGQALIWRGPMLQSVLLQFLKDVQWGVLDYLVIDLPPGTGDVQLALAQNIQATGAVIVSTPQDIALSDVRRAWNMFDKVKIPILGIIENMSYFLCPHCGERTDIFSTGGAKEAAEQNNIQFLGEIPIDISIRKGGDEGMPAVWDESNPLFEIFIKIAQNIAGKISQISLC
ncbi:Mrp/NBP35 family ATP-binding protein [bacterium]|nr:Mrp/NBP35 family ATP-binding protein [bacterium]